MHTPGPWTHSIEKTGEGLEVKAGEVYVIAGCGCCGSPWMDNVDDAKLIAAAPEMLDALADLLDGVESAIKSGDWKVDGACDPEMSINRAKAAIAKATGVDKGCQQP